MEAVKGLIGLAQALPVLLNGEVLLLEVFGLHLLAVLYLLLGLLQRDVSLLQVEFYLLASDFRLVGSALQLDARNLLGNLGNLEVGQQSLHLLRLLCLQLLQLSQADDEAVLMIQNGLLHFRGVEDDNGVASLDVAAVGDYLRDFQSAEAPGDFRRRDVDGAERFHLALLIDIDEERAVAHHSLGDDGIGFLSSTGKQE